MHAIRIVSAAVSVLALLAVYPYAQSIRDRVRLSPEKLSPITEEQANELTLTLNDAAVRPIQVWVRTAGRIEPGGRVLTATIGSHEAEYVKVGQRVRAFPPESRSSMFQARVTTVTAAAAGTKVTVTLSGPPHAGSMRYILEIVTEPLEALSIPNEAIIEANGEHIVYVQADKGRYLPREIQPGLQGELYTEIKEGVKAGDQVVTFGSFFIDADHRLKVS
jgi:multidrug efflux pump subunit AcrA (membrane-fusion protein)